MSDLVIGNKKMGGRIGYLDALRGLAILFVIEGHVRVFGMDIKSYDTLSALMLYSFYLPLFFFVSGYLAHKENLTKKDILRNGSKKFVFLVLPAISFSIGYNLLNHRDVLYPMYAGFGRYWFTITLFECFVIYYMILLVFKCEKARTTILIIIAIIGILALSYKSIFGPKLIDTNHLCKYFYFFTFGILSKKYNSTYTVFIKNEYVKAFSIITFFVLLFLIDYQIFPSPVFHLLRDVLLRVLGTLVIIILFASNASYFEGSGRAARILNEIGRKSLPIYLLQYFFLPDFSAFQDIITNMDQFTIHVIAALYTVFVTVVCYVFIIVLEQSKFVRTYLLGLK